MGLDGLLAMGCLGPILLLIGFFIGCVSSGGGNSTEKKDDSDDDDRTLFD